jgi:hypothetical protein
VGCLAIVRCAAAGSRAGVSFAAAVSGSGWAVVAGWWLFSRFRRRSFFGVAAGQTVIAADLLGAAEFLAVGGIVTGRFWVAHLDYL